MVQTVQPKNKSYIMWEDVTLSFPPAGPVFAHLADNVQQQSPFDSLRATIQCFYVSYAQNKCI